MSLAYHQEFISPPSTSIISETSAEQLVALYTKSTPIYALKFGATNYLVAAGVFVAKPDEH